MSCCGQHTQEATADRHVGATTESCHHSAEHDVPRHGCCGADTQEIRAQHATEPGPQQS